MDIKKFVEMEASESDVEEIIKDDSSERIKQFYDEDELRPSAIRLD